MSSATILISINNQPQSQEHLRNQRAATTIFALANTGGAIGSAWDIRAATDIVRVIRTVVWYPPSPIVVTDRLSDTETIVFLEKS
jgi:hypothetical protein